eukprot:m.135184 g.135184  ORF g.135184 m.135184 type:complete len:61 (-) comp16939_c1_seq2:909-1091(-)
MRCVCLCAYVVVQCVYGSAFDRHIRKCDQNEFSMAYSPCSTNPAPLSSTLLHCSHEKQLT